MLLVRLQNGEIAGIWAALPCNTFSTARRGKRRLGDKRGWPPPLRKKGEGIYGLPGLTSKELKKVQADLRMGRPLIDIH